MAKTRTCFSLRHSSSPPLCQPQPTIGWKCRPSRRSRCHPAEHWWTECPEEAETDRQTDRQTISQRSGASIVHHARNKVSKGEIKSGRETIMMQVAKVTRESSETRGTEIE